MPSFIFVINDVADNLKLSRNSKILHSLCIRMRHNYISTIITTHKYNALAPIIRMNTSCLIIFEFRTDKDLETILCEYSAIVNKHTLLLCIMKQHKKNIPCYILI